MTHWIWQHKDWPKFIWDDDVLSPHLAQARLTQGKLLGIMQTINEETARDIGAMVLEKQAIDTSAIEGEHLNRDSVRSSIANRLGLERAGIHAQPDRYIEGLLDMLQDATENYADALTLDRLFGWHAALFPTGYSGIRKITVASLRESGPMHIVSGRPGKETVHYEAPPASEAKAEIKDFLAWINGKHEIDGLLRAGLAHLWFELLHPFDDGNGRIGRAIIDLALAQDEQLAVRCYSLSSAIMYRRKSYYACLEKTCRGDMNITPWLMWFLNCFESATQDALHIIDKINQKRHFWEKHASTPLNKRQIKALNSLLDAGKDGFEGDMTTRKYANLTKTSRATAYRELNNLVEKQCLKPTAKKGRSAAYEINWNMSKFKT